MGPKRKRSAGGLAAKDLLPTLAPREKTMNIAPYSEDGAFGPNDIKAMLVALDQVCIKLNLTNDAKKEREFLAKRIIAEARRGDRDSTVLRDGMLREIAVRAWRGLGNF